MTAVLSYVYSVQRKEIVMMKKSIIQIEAQRSVNALKQEIIVANNNALKSLGLDYSVQEWQDKRINAINRILSKARYNHKEVAEKYIDEYTRVCNSKAIDKREYKKENVKNS